MSLALLDKTRKINQLLNKQESDKIDFNEFCRVFSHAMNVNVLLVSRKGKVLGLKKRRDVAMIPQLETVVYGSYIENQIQERFLNVLSTKENVNLLTLGFEFEESQSCQAMVSPVCMAGKRLGTLFIYRDLDAFSIDDIILTEYGTMVIGLAMQRAESEEMTAEQHKEQDVMDAIHTLSKLEAKAMYYVLDELEDVGEGILVTSRLADKVGITRSVIINGLKKCESAGIIRTKSSGMKGTSIWVTNDLFTCEAIQSYMEE